MQLTNPPTDAQFLTIAEAMHDARLERYLPAAGGDQADAFRLYLWNCALCEAFYLPLHITEIVVRNAIHNVLIDRIGEQWHTNKTFYGLLDSRYQSDLDDAVNKERKQHGVLMSCHHIVSALSFGFWQHLLTKRFTRLLWPNDVKAAFPNLPNQKGREDVFLTFDTIRNWRNRIAHHRAIFDKGPMRHYQQTLLLARWASHDVADWLTDASKVTAAIDLRPVKPASSAPAS